MTNESATPQVLATNERGWCVLKHPDSKLQLDLGLAGLLIEQPQFQALDKLVSAALEVHQQVGRGMLAYDSATRSVYACVHHKVIILIFDQTILRFCSADFYRLAELCNEVMQLLPIPNLEETIDYLKNIIRPALSNN